MIKGFIILLFEENRKVFQVSVVHIVHHIVIYFVSNVFDKRSINLPDLFCKTVGIFHQQLRFSRRAIGKGNGNDYLIKELGVFKYAVQLLDLLIAGHYLGNIFFKFNPGSKITGKQEGTEEQQKEEDSSFLQDSVYVYEYGSQFRLIVKG